MTHMETYNCEHRGTRVGDFTEAQKNHFNGIKDKMIDNIVAQVEERLPENDLKVLKDLNTILQNYLTQQLVFITMVLRVLKDSLTDMLLRMMVYSMLMKQETHLSSSSTF